MISLDFLRSFPFFRFMNDKQLKEVAQISEEITFDNHEIIVESGKPANTFYFLIDGSTAYYCVVVNEHDPSYYKEYFINDINPGEIFGISSLIEPYIYTATVRVNEKSRVIKIDASALRALCCTDIKLAYSLMRSISKSALQRLDDTRSHLVSTRVMEPSLY